jgi:hypothetical protein
MLALLPLVTIPRGTDVPVTLDADVAIKQDQVGHTFAAHITRDVVVNGTVAIHAGAPAQVRLVESKHTPGAASFRLVSVSLNGQMHPVRTDIARADATESGSSTARKTGIGALAGGAVGLVLGGGEGLLKGAVAGAGGGLAWGLLDHGSRQLQHDARLLFSLRKPVRAG